MTMVISNESEVQLLTDLLGAGENWQLCLFHSNITPAETDTASTYTAQEASFTSYARKTLTRTVGASTWNTPVGQAPSGSPAWSSESLAAHSQYGTSAQSWTCGVTGDTVYGYFIIGATSGKLIAAEAFAAPRPLANGDVIQVQPVFEAV